MVRVILFGAEALIGLAAQNLQSMVVGSWELEAARKPFLVFQNDKLLRLAATDALDGPGHEKAGQVLAVLR